MKAYELIGQKLQKAREELGMSQKDLAKKLGCSQASLSNYELGKRRLYLSDLHRISKILNKPITYFLESQEENTGDNGNISNILNKQFLREILFEANELTPMQRRSVLDYIQWQKSRQRGDRR
ncbi:MAG: hypothetical protein DRG37_07895 [Deltaproteobacteria bacterium]|nr:MAG: hypothetical protein DRG37_07895 [Deltaproteobacteria bacterium]